MMARPRNPNWLATADEIREQIAASHFGQKNAIFRRYAEETGYAVSSLKRDVIAANFIAEARSQNPAFAADLRKLGSTTVTELARLFRENPAKALETARSAAHGTATRNDIVVERRVRPRADNAVRRHKNVAEFLYFLQRNGSLPGSLEAAEKVRFGPPHTGAFRSVTGETACVAYIQVNGPDTNPDALHFHLGLLLFYDHVFLGVPIVHLPEDWIETLKSMKTAPDRLHVFGQDSGGYMELWPIR
jgi:hypothetical protein